MLVEFEVLPLTYCCSEFFIFLLEAKLIREKVFLKIWLLLEKVLLFDCKEFNADMLSSHYFFYHFVDVHGLINKLEVNKGIHNLLNLLFLFIGNSHFVF